MCPCHNYALYIIIYSTCPTLSYEGVYPNAASEWKYFLLFYVPVTLYGILLDALYIQLVKAIRLLLGGRMTLNWLKNY